MKEISKALVLAQMEMGNAKKDSTNPFFKSRYADLNSVREACIPALNSHGIAVLQPTVHIDGKNFVKTVLLHESGESFESLTEIIYNKQNDAQAQGSGISYARRYGLQSLCNVGAEDDDGQKAVEQPKKKEAPKEDLKASYMKLWNDYLDLQGEKAAAPYHPQNWKQKSPDEAAYRAAIQMLTQKIEALKQPV